MLINPLASFTGTWSASLYCTFCTDKKENEIFLIYKEIQMGCKVIFEEGLPNMRKWQIFDHM
jgi:hypothetical protein